jgi:hypothetical protein
MVCSPEDLKDTVTYREAPPHSASLFKGVHTSEWAEPIRGSTSGTAPGVRRREASGQMPCQIKSLRRGSDPHGTEVIDVEKSRPFSTPPRSRSRLA